MKRSILTATLAATGLAIMWASWVQAGTKAAPGNVPQVRVEPAATTGHSLAAYAASGSFNSFGPTMTIVNGPGLLFFR